MADNVNVTPGTGVVIAADDIGGIAHQRVKVVIGADGISNGDISASNPMPVTGTVSTGLTQPLTDAQLRTTAVPVSGSVSVSNFPVTQAVSGTVTANTGLSQPITDAQIRATALPVSGTVAVTSSAITSIDVKTPALGQALAAASTPVVLTAAQLSTLTPLASVSVSNFPATQNVAITSSVEIEIKNDVLNPVPVNGTVTVTSSEITSIDVKTPVLGQALAAASTPVVLTAAQLTTLTPLASVSVSNFPVTQAVSGTVTVTSSAITSIDVKTPVLGQALAAASTPVVLTAAQLTTLTPLASVSVSNFPATQTVTGGTYPTSSPVTTYSTSITGLVPAGTPTDLFTISGSATRTIKILRMTLTASQTTATQRDILLIKRSTANTAGTSTAPVKIAHDSLSAVSTATVLAYTANPTLGTAVGAIRSRKVYVGTSATNSDEFISEFGERPSQPIVLRGVAESLCVNLNGVASAGGLFNISIEWTEE